MAGRMISEIGRDVSDPDPAVGSQDPVELVRLLVKDAHLLDAELGVSVSDGFPEIVAERVQHRVVWVDRREPVLLKLIGHDVHQRLHPCRVVGPIAHDLERDGSR